MNILIWNGERHDGHLSYMYHPVVWTLTEALEESGCCNVTAGSGFGDLGLFRGATLLLEKGDAFIFVGSASYNQAPWKELRARGVRLVYYNTEPLGCKQGIIPWPIDEWWDYSWANIDQCVATRKFQAGSRSGSSDVVVARFFPPGLLKGSPLCRNFGREGYGAGWAMLGRADASRARLGCFVQASTGLRRGNDFFEISHVWSNKSFRNLVESRRGPLIFLSFHKNCGQRHAPFEALRASLLLSAGAILVSEWSYQKDMREYKGIVTFAPVGNALKYAASTPLRMAASERKRQAGEAHTAFRRRFNPRQLLEKASIWWLQAKPNG